MIKDIKNRVHEFMSKYALTSDSIDVYENARKYTEEMARGLNGEKSSLRMIPTYFGPSKEIPANKKVIVLDAGGTNLRTASVYFDVEGNVHIENVIKTKMPGIKSEIGYKELFSYIADFIKPVLGESDTIAFCFSYASIPTPDRDGIVNEMGKQVKIKDIVGKSLAKGLNGALRDIGCGEKHIVVLNDSVTTLLGGSLKKNGIDYSSYIGFILGTGLNASYIEKTEKIGKLKGESTQESMIINTESGDYDKFPRGLIDEVYDRTFNDYGSWKFEKMTSGRYQGGLIAEAVRKACEEGLFSDEFNEKFNKLENIESFEIDKFLLDPNGDTRLSVCCGGDESDDALTLYYIVDCVIDRAAKVVCSALAAMMLKADCAKNPLKPCCITCDGSTFYKSVMFKSKLEYYMKKYVADEMGLYYRLNRVDDVNMIGSAIAGICC